MQLRPYQTEAVNQIKQILFNKKVCYLVGEVRTGKTIVSMNAFHQLGFKSVLFITKKSAISSIKSDLENSGLRFECFDIVNFEMVHKITRQYTAYIIDEAHCIGSYPKPSIRAKTIRNQVSNKPVLLMSGTPTPESFSQLFHQFWVTGLNSPWNSFKNFYAWAKENVEVKKVYIRMGLTINDFSQCKDSVVLTFNLYKVTMTQKDAGFNGSVVESVHVLKMPEECKQLIRTLRKDKLSKPARIVTDTATKLMQSIHQISSGTYINSEQKRVVLSTYKMDYIKNQFKGRTAIFYAYIAEGEMLKEGFKGKWTDKPEDFNSGKYQYFIKQIHSGKEGINLSTADNLIFFNIVFSAVAYWQGRARSQSISGGDKKVHWLFSDCGIEQKIYRTVIGKKNFTTKHFNERDYDQL